jgi:hypothetical protein
MVLASVTAAIALSGLAGSAPQGCSGPDAARLRPPAVAMACDPLVSLRGK